LNRQEEKLFPIQLKFNLKTLIIILIFAIGLYFLLPRLIGIQQAIRLILQVKQNYLILAILAEIVSYIGAAWLLGIILQRLGYKIKFWDRFRIGSIAAFAIHFFPVGTFGEGAVDYYFLKKKNVESGSILLMLVLRIIISYIAFLSLFVISLILVPTAPHLALAAKIISLVICVLIIVGIFYIIYLYRHKDRFRRSMYKFLKFVDFFLSRFRGRQLSESRTEEIFEDIYTGIGLFGRKKRFFILAIFASLIYWLGDMTCLFFVFASLGYTIHFGVLIFGYAVSTLLGMISFIPGGLGVFEGSMALIYTGLGVPSDLTLMSILIFRLFSFWLWIPFGLYSFISLTKKNK